MQEVGDHRHAHSGFTMAHGGLTAGSQQAHGRLTLGGRRAHSGLAAGSLRSHLAPGGLTAGSRQAHGGSHGGTTKHLAMGLGRAISPDLVDLA